ncbi:hypothetical protein GTP38_24360 [Duganella sp. FT94W]|uniref:Uncharacterized protein n=1 Tax=Duganella lactea TaxID=2692173 RepID=A0ABW9VFU7_9BURK|nr:hypothetical protein [Duganella lactea]MYM37463.1 hypothetical protein [Duganella lactea]
MNTSVNRFNEEIKSVLDIVKNSFELLSKQQKGAIVSLLGRFRPDEIAAMITQLSHDEKLLTANALAEAERGTHEAPPTVSADPSHPADLTDSADPADSINSKGRFDLKIKQVITELMRSSEPFASRKLSDRSEDMIIGLIAIVNNESANQSLSGCKIAAELAERQALGGPAETSLDSNLTPKSKPIVRS